VRLVPGGCSGDHRSGHQHHHARSASDPRIDDEHHDDLAYLHDLDDDHDVDDDHDHDQPPSWSHGD
jgi:hypothetical protein